MLTVSGIEKAIRHHGRIALVHPYCSSTSSESFMSPVWQDIASISKIIAGLTWYWQVLLLDDFDILQIACHVVFDCGDVSARLLAA
jgi:hypothetical protein